MPAHPGQDEHDNDRPLDLSARAESDGKAILATIRTCRDAINTLDDDERRAVMNALASLFGCALVPKAASTEPGSTVPTTEADTEWAEQFVAQVLLSDALVGAALRLDESKRKIDGIAERLEQAVDDTSRQLAESEERYSHLFAHVHEGVFACDSSGCFLDVNPAVLDMIGYSSREALVAECTFDALFADPAASEPLFANLCKLEHVQNIERELVRRDGRHIHVLLTATLVRDGEGTPTGFEGILHDVTERVRLQESLVEAQRIEAVRQTVVTCCHEINQPLTVLCSHVQLLLERCELESRDAEIELAMSEEAAKLAEVMIKIGRIREVRTKPYLEGLEMLDLESSSSDDGPDA